MSDPEMLVMGAILQDTEIAVEYAPKIPLGALSVDGAKLLEAVKYLLAAHKACDLQALCVYSPAVSAYACACSELAGTGVDVKFYFEELMQAHKTRLCDAAISSTQSSIRRNPRKAPELMASLGVTLGEITSCHATKPDTRILDLAAWRQELAQAPVRDIKLGYPSLDAILGGVARSNLLVLAANPGMGKTSLAMCIAVSLSQRGTKVGIVSLEMSSAELQAKLYTAILGQRCRPELEQRLSQRLSAMAEIVISDSCYSLGQVEAKIAQLASSGHAVVIVDYLQLIDCQGESQEVQIATVSKALKRIAKQHSVLLIVLSQLSRRNTQREDHRPQLSDLRGSGSIEQDADQVIFLHREQYYAADASGKAELLVRKNRHGMTGTAYCDWVPDLGIFA